jgi:integrase
MDHTGVYEHYGSIRISFQWKGKRCREVIKLPPTKKNLEYAANLRGEILRKIVYGTFRYRDYFPDSELAEKVSSPTFFDVAKTWIEGQSHLAFSTEKEYRAMLNRYWLPDLGDIEISKITSSTLLEVIAKQSWSAKTRNNALGPLKNVFDLAHMDGFIDSNPAAKIKNAKVQKPEPDPLSLDETTLVLEWMEREPQWKHYFEVAFFTGMRTSELIALRWGDVDFHKKTIRVHRAKVRSREKGTKTATIRDIELSSRALDALMRHKQHTFMRGEEVFIHPHTGEPIVDDRPPRLFWESALKACGLRHRAAYQTRHTCISLWLMAGANPMWVARQAGHSSPQMTFNRYARWIARADAGLEMAKVEAKLDAGSIPKSGTERD